MAETFSAEVIRLNLPNGLPGRVPLIPPYDTYNFKKRKAAFKKRKNATAAIKTTPNTTA
jgi:hypothetical protein